MVIREEEVFDLHQQEILLERCRLNPVKKAETFRLKATPFETIQIYLQSEIESSLCLTLHNSRGQLCHL